MSQLKQFLVDNGTFVTQKETDLLIHRLDLDRDGFVSVDDFTNFFMI